MADTDKKRTTRKRAAKASPSPESSLLPKEEREALETLAGTSLEKISAGDRRPPKTGRPPRTRKLPEARVSEYFDSETLAGGRASYDFPSDGFEGAWSTILGLTEDDYFRQGLHLDPYTLDRTSPSKLLEYLVEVSPEFSRALFDFHTMCNPGYEIKCLNSDSKTVNKAAQKIFDEEVMGTLRNIYGSPDVVFDRIFTTIFMRGGAATETVLGPDARTFVDLATPDPAYFEWRRLVDPYRGPVWVTGQRQKGQWVNLDQYITFKYVPFHPRIGRPKGRSLATSAIYICVFLMSLLHDLKRVIQHQGYPRIDVAVDFDKLRMEMPKKFQNDSERVKQWAKDIVLKIKDVYKNLKPDDTYIHSSAVTVNTPKGALGNLSLGAIEALFSSLERMATRALKSMPLLMATTIGVSEANANRQWEIHVQSINSVQHLGEAVLENAFNVAMRARGVRTRVQVRFAELRASEAMRDAQVDMLRTVVARARYDNGYWSQDEAAFYATGKDAADQQEPREVKPSTNESQGGMGGTNQGLGGGVVDPGASRSEDAMTQARRYTDNLLNPAAPPIEVPTARPPEELQDLGDVS